MLAEVDALAIERMRMTLGGDVGEAADPEPAALTRADERREDPAYLPISAAR